MTRRLWGLNFEELTHSGVPTIYAATVRRSRGRGGDTDPATWWYTVFIIPVGTKWKLLYAHRESAGGDPRLFDTPDAAQREAIRTLDDLKEYD